MLRRSREILGGFGVNLSFFAIIRPLLGGFHEVHACQFFRKRHLGVQMHFFSP
eukprot:COSAG01_NODE_818_length_13345_cov_29.829533_3_plen_53_part_00